MHNTYIKILVCEICLVTLDLFGVSDDVTEDCVFSFMNGTDGRPHNKMSVVSIPRH
jgi:hypothetical protein